MNVDEALKIAGRDASPGSSGDVLAHEVRKLRLELDEARRERAGMQHLAQKNKAEVERLRARDEAAQAVIQAALAYADSTAAPTDAPHEDALLDAVAAYRDALVRAHGKSAEETSDG